MYEDVSVTKYSYQGVLNVDTYEEITNAIQFDLSVEFYNSPTTIQISNSISLATYFVFNPLHYKLVFTLQPMKSFSVYDKKE